ncbi:hydrolase, partial [filamentous cyanobacterium CCP5]
HGIVAQSYSWRGIMPTLADQGFRAIAPDWIGHGFSDKPDKRDFAYTPDAFVEALSQFVDALGLEKFHLVAQGFMGTAGIQYALRHPQRVDRLVMVNAPISPTAKLPWKLRQFAIPLAGDMLTQDPLLVDRTLEGGGPYQVDDADLDVYRRPFLTTSSSGRSLMMTVKRMNLTEVATEIHQGLASWDHPTLVVWGLSDPWLPVEIAQDSVDLLANGQLERLDQVGHYAQEDWAEKVGMAIDGFLRQMTV